MANRKVFTNESLTTFVDETRSYVDNSVNELSVQVAYIDLEDNEDEENYTDPLEAKVNTHMNDKSNPHGVTASQVGAYTKTETDAKLNAKANATDIPSTTENWTFILEDGTEVGKTVYIDEDGVTNPNGFLITINNGVSVVDAGLTYSRGVVEVRKIGGILWVIDSGVYNFTDSFAESKNRTVLQFDLPKELSNKLHNVNGVYGTTGTIGYSPALAYENVTYTTFNCQSYLKRSAIGEEYDTFQLVYTGLSAINGGGLCGFHLKMPLFLIGEVI